MLDVISARICICWEEVGGSTEQRTRAKVASRTMRSIGCRERLVVRRTRSGVAGGR